ncbi:MAG: glycosyltransferase family 2 protein [Acidobacteriaceae bacterium]|nr:glycosyltransferase family 2 protein [Acidobacteriaceae bacterium]
MSPATAVIVTYNSGAHLAAAVASCRQFGIPVVIVDNASTDGTVFPADVTLLRNEANRGFAAAVNQGVRAHTAPLTLLLNPDARLLTGVGSLCEICVANRHTAATGLLVEADGRPQKGFSIRRLPTAAALVCEVLGINRLWPDNPVNRSYRCMDIDLHKQQLVEQPAGALFLFRRDDWEELSGFDERYFPVWFEDVDFARRFRAAGGVIVLEPTVLALHAGGHSVQKLPDSCQIRFWYGSLLRYVVQHFGAVTRRLIAGCVLLGLVARSILGIFLLRGWPVFGAHLDSIRLSARCVALGKIRNH